jgi:rfaE bifunctional protein, domain I
MGREAASLLGKMAGVKVLCIGDIMLDRYVYGSANRISPEAPVPVVHVSRQVIIPGGVGNVVKNLESLGVLPIAVSVIGDDANADLLCGFLKEDGRANLSLVRDPSRPTIVKTRIVAGIQQVVRFDEEIVAPLAGAVEEQVLSILDALLDQVGAVAASDYAKGVMTPSLTRELIKRANARNIPVAIDPKGRHYEKYAEADLVKPNRRELAEATGMDVSSDAAVAEAARSLMRRHGIRNVLVTMSERGMMLFQHEDAGEKPAMLPSKAREVYDVTGAGDTVLSCMAASMAIGAPLELGARLATMAAGIVVGKVGTAVASAREIENAG